MRPNICSLTVLGILAGLLILKSQLDFQIIPAIVSGFILCGAGNVINDYFDYNADKLNRPERPLVSGKIKRRNALYFYVLLSIVGLIITFFVSINFFVIALISLALFTLYPSILKKIPAIKNIIVSILATIPFLSSALIYNNFNFLFSSPLFTFSTIAFFGTLSREIFKDIEDMQGDQRVNVRTLPIIFGQKNARILGDVILIVACLLLFYPVIFEMISYWYFVGIIPALTLCGYALISKDIKTTQKSIKVAMFFVLLGFILGSWL